MNLYIYIAIINRENILWGRSQERPQSLKRMREEQRERQAHFTVAAG